MAGLILRGNLKLGTTSGSATEVGSEIVHFRMEAAVDQVDVKETMGTPATKRAGATDYTLALGYLSTDTTGSVFMQLWDAAATQAGTLYFEGSLRDEAISATNPKWSGTFVVTEASIGGDAEAVSEANATYPLIASPAQATS